MEALGRLFNVAKVIAPIDLASGAQTGARVHLKDCSGVAFIYFADAGTAGEDVDLDVQQHTAASAGTSADLDVVTRWFSKRETTLDNDEQWVKHTQTAASEVDLGEDEGENEVIAVVEVSTKSLSDGYEWVSVNTTDAGATAGKLGCVLAITYDLTAQRSPELLADLL
ncbi:hypothetical protein ACH5A7_20840 [Streptomyces sp. NPDC018955]|uniref:hypothetical protein n=1 Tax=Streptomyces sp. NPDC018955 TaxID=3365055 RepID=UPI0037962286